MDGDGNEDIFLSQNFFATEPRTGRYDGGRGLWLRGDGKGSFAAVPANESGVRIYGEQRGAAVCDYDEDGRVDLVVTQNGADTKLYKNFGARPGLRVRLSGPPGNPKGIGTTLRLVSGAITGYWSQDSTVQVLALPERPTQLQVRWPGGKSFSAAIPKKAREIQVDVEGTVKLVKSE